MLLTFAIVLSTSCLRTLASASDGSPDAVPLAKHPVVTDSNAALSSLSLGNEALNPGFSSGVVTYTATVASSTAEVTVTAVTSGSNATLTIDGKAATSGKAVTVPLKVGENKIPVRVTASNKRTKLAYTVTVLRLNSDTKLSRLSLKGEPLSPAFNHTATAYDATLPASGTSTVLTVAAHAATSTPSVQVNGGDFLLPVNSSVPLSLNIGDNTVVVIVTAQDGSEATYTLKVHVKNPDADLAGLTLSDGTLSPAFSSGSISYTTLLSSTATQVVVTPVRGQTAQTIKVDGKKVVSGQGFPVTLKSGTAGTTVTVAVVAESGKQKTYTVTVYRESSKNSLTGLALSVGKIAFSELVTSYSLTATSSQTSATLTATAAESHATIDMQVDGGVYTQIISGQNVPIVLNAGDNTIDLAVRAQDGSVKSYTLAVAIPSANAALAGLVLSAGSLSPAFTSSGTSYRTSIASGVTSVTVTPVKADPNATVTVNGGAVDQTGSYSVQLTGSDTPVAITVVAGDKVTTQTYLLTIHVKSSDATLSSLVLGAGATLSSSFSSATTSYLFSLPANATTATLTAATNNSSATLAVQANQSGFVSATSGTPLSLAMNTGANTINVAVTAEDGSTQNYTLRTAGSGVRSSDCTLSSLSLSNASFTFSPSTSSYNVIATGSTTAILTPQANSPLAVIAVQDNGNGYTAAASGSGFPVALNPGDNSIAITVTAQDGTVQTYTLNVYLKSSDATLSNLTATPGAMTPVFTPAGASYEVAVSASTKSVSITPTLDNMKATLQVNGASAQSGATVSVSPSPTDTLVPILVTAEDGIALKTYTVTVHEKSSDATLSSLTLGGTSVSLSPGITAYNVNAVHGLTSTPILAQTTNAHASLAVQINGGQYFAISSGTPSTAQPLNVGNNTATIMVTAEDGTVNVYTVTLYVASPDAALSTLLLSTGAFNFAPGTTSYTVVLSSGITSVTVTPITDSSKATLTVNASSASSGSDVTLPLSVGDNSIVVTVTAEDGTVRSYALTLHVKNSDAGLSSLVFSAAANGLTPAFSTAGVSYYAAIPSSGTATTVTAVADDPVHATLSLQASGSGYSPLSSGSVSGVQALNPADNLFNVKVIAEDGTQKIYAANLHVMSSDGTLWGLGLSSGSWTPFVSSSTSYSMVVAYSIGSLTLTPTANNYASINISLNGGSPTSASPNSSAGPFALQVGSNTIVITVQSEDKLSTQTYTLSVYRVAAPVTNAPTIGSDGVSVYFDATIDANATSAQFLYGTTQSYGNSTLLQATYGTDYSDSATGLATDTVYYCCVAVTTGTVTDYGNVVSFMTPIVYQPTVFAGGGQDGFSKLGDPSVNSNADGVFKATVTGSTGIWFESGGDPTTNMLMLPLGVPTALTNSDGSTVNITLGFASVSDPILNDNDQIAFTSGGNIYMADTSPTLQRVAKIGDPVVDVNGSPVTNAAGNPTGATFTSFTNFVLTEPGDVFFAAPTSKGQQGIWMWSGGSDTMVATTGADITGDVTGTPTISSLVVFGTASGTVGQTRGLNSNEDLLFTAVLSDGSKAVYEYSGGSVSPVVTTNDDLSQVPNAAPGSTYVSFDSPIIDDNGDVAVLATVTANSATGSAMVLVFSGSTPAFLAKTGDQAPDWSGSTGALGGFVTLGDPLLNETNLAFLGAVASGSGIWLYPTASGISSPVLVALVGDIANDSNGNPTTATFASFQQVVLPDSGLLFLATLSTGQQGIWALNANSGLLVRVALAGDLLQVGAGYKTVASISIFNPSIQSRNINSGGTLMYRATFTDSTIAIIQVPSQQ